MVRALSAQSGGYADDNDDSNSTASSGGDVQLLRSCESCRRKKRKCSGDRPACTRCVAQGEKCSYRPTARFLKPRPGDPLAQRKAHHHLHSHHNHHGYNNNNNSSSSSGNNNNSNHSQHQAKKKRASIATASLHHRACDSVLGGGVHRPRATSVVAAAALRNAQRQHMAAASVAGDVMGFAPADLMLSPPLTMTPAGLSPGAAAVAAGMPASDPASAACSSPQLGGLAPGGASGLAYMSTAGASVSPQLLLSGAAPPPPLAMQQQQQQQQQQPPSLPPPVLCNTVDYAQLLASAFTQQQQAAAMLVSTASAPLMCSPPLSCVSLGGGSLSTSPPLALPAGQAGLVPWSMVPFADPALAAAAAAGGGGGVPTPAMMPAGMPPMPMLGVGMSDIYSPATAAAAATAAAGYMGSLDAILPQSKSSHEWLS
ncbi:hypothetical protein H4R18_003859 [Coemansia javaensis]|uniref:Zn(2)-C6 fungal-type domain-containing protein n=1 Tax=Coemansia javaensis TaxID=2761396 RepID=A0A9W8H9A6_9FUNG|nr:hypothetical protein H4R18_003859 [Coemansia javaensis]